MKFKLSNDEIISMIALIEQVLAWEGKGEGVPEMLVIAIMQDLHIKLLQRSLIKKAKYRLQLSPPQALAVFILFNGRFSQTSQTGNLVQTMCNAIHQQLIC